MEQRRLQRVGAEIAVDIGFGDADEIGKPAMVLDDIDLTALFLHPGSRGRPAVRPVDHGNSELARQLREFHLQAILDLGGDLAGLLEQQLLHRGRQRHAERHQVLAPGAAVGHHDMGLEPPCERGRMGEHIVTLAVASNRNNDLAYHAGLLEQPFDLALIVQHDRFGRRYSWKSGHRHDLAADHDDESGAGTQAHLADG